MSLQNKYEKRASVYFWPLLKWVPLAKIKWVLAMLNFFLAKMKKHSIGKRERDRRQNTKQGDGKGKTSSLESGQNKKRKKDLS